MPKRSEKRARVILNACLLVAGGELPVRLRDLSQTGALCEASRPPAQSSLVVLACGAIAAPAVVAWVVGRRFGLVFDPPVDAELVTALVGDPRIG